MRKPFNFIKKRAQGMTEYIVIVGLIAILLIASVKAFKGSVEGAFYAAEAKITEEVTLRIPANSG